MKNYLIIGASSGIGLALSKLLAKEHQVFGTYNTHEIPSYANCNYQHFDVNDEQSKLDFLPEILDGFVYCPGSIILKPFGRIASRDFIEDYKIGLVGAVKSLQLALPALKKSKNASIVLFSTVAVQTGMPFHAVVSATKGAIEGLTKSLAAELAPTIRVNCIAPSLVETPLAESLINSEERKSTMNSRHPLKRIGKPDEIANLVEFLLSEKSGWISGQIIHQDGGMGSLKL